MPHTEDHHINPKKVAFSVAVVGAFGLGAFVIARFKSAQANEMLVRSGWLVRGDGIQVGRKFVQWPFQFVEKIPLEPKTYLISLNAMSKEKMPFVFPGRFAIGPKNDTENLKRYATRMLMQTEQDHSDIIHAIIEGESRSLAAGLEMEQIFEGRAAFKDDIIKAVAEPFDKLGLEIVSANLRDLADGESSNYFKELSKKIQAQASNNAKVDVSEQEKRGTIGEKERSKETRINVAKLEAESTLQENQRKEQILESNAKLEKTRAEQNFIARQAKIKAEAEASVLEAVTQREIQAKLVESETEKERAINLSKTRVGAEISIKQAEGLAETVKLAADAELHKRRQEAEGIRAKMEAEALGELAIARSKASGVLLDLEAKAEGQLKLLSAQAEGFKQIQQSMSKELIDYLMIDRNVITDIATQQAAAVKGMAPNVTIWSPTGDKVTDALKGFVPTLDTITKQTGYSLPSWIVNEPKRDMASFQAAKSI